MPPKKEVKEKPIKGDEAEELILEYMKACNRPYSATDVATNLKGKVAKTLAQKILTTLSDKGDLTVKSSGKQTIFVYNQANLNTASSEELAELEDELKQAKEQLVEKNKELKSIHGAIAAKIALPKTKDLQSEISRVSAENQSTLKALLPFRGDQAGGPKVDPLTEEEMKAIDGDFAKWRKQWVDRRKVYKELLDLLQEGGQVLDKASFEDDLGIALDDDETKEIEDGEFVKVAPVIRRPPVKGSTGKTAPASVKRPAASAATDDPVKKKAKKAKV